MLHKNLSLKNVSIALNHPPIAQKVGPQQAILVIITNTLVGMGALAVTLAAIAVATAVLLGAALSTVVALLVPETLTTITTEEALLKGLKALQDTQIAMEVIAVQVVVVMDVVAAAVIIRGMMTAVAVTLVAITVAHKIIVRAILAVLMDVAAQVQAITHKIVHALAPITPDKRVKVAIAIIDLVKERTLIKPL